MPKLLNILFPTVRAEILRLLFTTPGKQRYVRELMGMSGLALRTVQEELSKLATAGLVTSWSNGYHRFYQANANHPVFADLLHIVEASPHLSAIERLPRRSRSHKKSRQRNRGRLPADRPLKWGLFSPRRR